MGYTTQSCGKAHAYCSACRPDVAVKVRKHLQQPGFNRYGRQGLKCGPMPKETRNKISDAMLRLKTRPPIQWGNKHAKGNTFKHTAEARAKISANRTPVDFTPRLRARIAVGVAKAHARGDYRRGPTNLEYALQMLLEDAGIDFEAQRRFGRYIVDVYSKDRNLVFEADGSFWNHHKDTNRERRRDEYLIDRGVSAVIHLDAHDLDPWLEAK